MNMNLANLTALALLSACSQNPQFKINSANQVYKSGYDLNTLLAKAELDAFQNPSTYAANVDSYASAIGGFQVGRQVALVQPTGLFRSKGIALDTLESDLEECIAKIAQMAELHRTSGIDPKSNITQAVRASCDKAIRSVAANETSAWIVTTAAGDL
jgi:hypothetical protein